MNQTVREISQMLADRAEEVCARLLPGGKKNGAEWESGSTSGDKGKSCKVRLSGPRAGLWCDFATGSDSGDLLDLWAVSRGVKLPDAIREAKEWLGIKEPPYTPRHKTYSKPKIQTLPPASEPVQEYLINERKLTKATLSAFGVAESGDGRFVAFPSMSPNGELLQVKHIGIARDEHGKKIVRTEAGCAPSLFGWQAFAGGRTVAITEGEIDAMTVHQIGMPALSVPFGAGVGAKNEWIDYEWDNLAQFENIYLCYDNDAAGQACIEEVARRLGIHRVKVVTFPGKDANECLQNGVSDDEMLECFENAKTYDPPEIRAPSDYRTRVQNYFYPTEEMQNRTFAPKLFEYKIGFRPGELTIWTGCNSHGKSVMVGQIMLQVVMINESVAIASMEMKPEQTLGRMLRQLWARKTPSPSEINQALDWMSGRLWIYDIMGNVPTAKILELLEFSVRRHRVTHFVIDSLMKCEVGGEDYDGQRKFLNDIVTFAKKNNCHIHLIAHPRKHDEEKPIGRIAVSGSSDISNQADNVISVWRNKAKERSEKVWTNSDAVVLCDKQRETGWEGYIDLDFSKTCEQFMRQGKEVCQYWKLVRASDGETQILSSDTPEPSAVPLDFPA